MRARINAGKGGAAPGAGAVRSLVSVFTTTVRAEGVRGLYGGYTTALLFAGPTNALYFISYETAKARIAASGSFGAVGEETAAVHLLAGFAAECGASLLWTPFDVIKQRLQVQQRAGLAPGGRLAAGAGTTVADATAAASPNPQGVRYRSTFHVAQSVVATEGFRALFKGWGAGIATYGPFSAVYFMTYERMKAWLVPPADTEASAKHLICGMTAGATAGAVTQPVDAIKTRIQVSQTTGSASVSAVLTRVLREEGLRGLTRGTAARVMWLTPSAGIMITVFEWCKVAYA